jgi:hypothetical protein
LSSPFGHSSLGCDDPLLNWTGFVLLCVQRAGGHYMIGLLLAFISISLYLSRDASSLFRETSPAFCPHFIA